MNCAARKTSGTSMSQPTVFVFRCGRSDSIAGRLLRLMFVVPSMNSR